MSLGVRFKKNLSFFLAGAILFGLSTHVYFEYYYHAQCQYEE
jgi:hypothetical protein